MIDPKRSRAFFAGEMVVLAGFIGESLLAYERLRELAGLARAMLTAADEGAREADRREAHEVLSIILMEVTRLAGE